eukprot:11171052-Alexandrium_andersonii.AAC.1
MATYSTPFSWPKVEVLRKSRPVRAPLLWEQLQLLLGPVRDGTHLGVAAEQESPCSVLPQAVALGLGLEVDVL